MFAESHDETVLDVDELLGLARDRSAAARTELVEIISDLFFDGDRVLTDRERTTMSDIMRHLIHDVELSVRKHLAIRLSDEPEAPTELIYALANDEAEIAHPILVRSEVLQEPELIEIIHNRTLEHQLAIAMRASVSESVTDALVETDETSVITRLLENPGADIGQQTMAYLVEQSQRVDEFQNPLVRREDLPKDLAVQMYWWVSAALRSEILDKYDLDPNQLDDVMELSVDAAVRTDKIETEDDGATDRLVEELLAKYRLSADLLIQVLRTGEVALFEKIIEKGAELRPNLAQRLIYEPGGEGLAIACRALGFTVSEFNTLHGLCRQARPDVDTRYPINCGDPQMFYMQIKPAAAERILDRWRRNPNYLNLLRKVDALTIASRM